jgi:hypothetical protein
VPAGKRAVFWRPPEPQETRKPLRRPNCSLIGDKGLVLHPSRPPVSKEKALAR